MSRKFSKAKSYQDVVKLEKEISNEYEKEFKNLPLDV